MMKFVFRFFNTPIAQKQFAWNILHVRSEGYDKTKSQKYKNEDIEFEWNKHWCDEKENIYSPWLF